MSQTDYYWFHCGSCGCLFQEAVGNFENRTCPQCGLDPAPVIQEAAAAPVSPVGLAFTMQMAAAAPADPYKKRSYKKLITFLKIIGVWLLFIGLIVWGAEMIWGGDPVSQTPQDPVVAEELRDSKPLSDEEIYFEEQMPACLEVLKGYLAAKTVEEQLPYLWSKGLDVEMMKSYIESAALSDIDANTSTLVVKSKLDFGDGEAILTHWENEDGDLFDAVFIKQGEKWKLDWHHFVRYSSQAWPMFLAGSGTDEGEFRLLARERYPEKRVASKNIEVMLYAPRHAHMDEAGFKATIEPLPLDSPGGKVLAAGFDQAKEGVSFFGSSIKRVNPDEMIRVRLKVRRISGDGTVRYEITDVSVCHWLNTDKSYLSPVDQAEEE